MESSDDAPWTSALRVEEWAGETRVNLIRLLAIAAFYGFHLLNFYLLSKDITPQYHFAATGIALAWTAGSLALHIALVRRWNPPYLKYAAAGGDAFLMTALLLLSGGPQSPLLVLLFLLIATASLRLRLRLVWAATGLCVLSYAFVCGHARWVRPEWMVPRTREIIFTLGLVCAGLLAGQAVRQARRFARDYGARFWPEPPA